MTEIELVKAEIIKHETYAAMSTDALMARDHKRVSDALRTCVQILEDKLYARKDRD